METTEHTEIGNQIRIHPCFIENNPYVTTDAQGVVKIQLQQVLSCGVPVPINLELSAGEIVGMAGDYFTDANWVVSLNLPRVREFKTSTNLANALIETPVGEQEKNALLKAYNQLASPNVSRKLIDQIYTINKTDYVPWFSGLNQYVQTLALNYTVPNYGQMLVRNITHFTPWSVRVYMIGHAMALDYARHAHNLMGIAKPHATLTSFKQKGVRYQDMDMGDKIMDLAHRYQALSLSIELFTGHYFSDGFAAGHTSMVGDLRVLLSERFGVLGNILLNNLHNELNQVGVYTARPYDPTPLDDAGPILAQGDGMFDEASNVQNKQACFLGMQASINDLECVFRQGQLIEQKKFNGLEHLPDVDMEHDQPQPLFIVGNDDIIYYRQDLSKIRIVSPHTLNAIRAKPIENGYVKLDNMLTALLLVIKLRIFAPLFVGKIQPESQLTSNVVSSNRYAFYQNKRAESRQNDVLAVPGMN